MSRSIALLLVLLVGGCSASSTADEAAWSGCAAVGAFEAATNQINQVASEPRPEQETAYEAWFEAARQLRPTLPDESMRQALDEVVKWTEAELNGSTATSWAEISAGVSLRVYLDEAARTCRR